MNQKLSLCSEHQRENSQRTLGATFTLWPVLCHLYISKESSQNWSAFPLHSPINPVPSNQTSVGSRNCISGVWFFSSFRNFCCEMQKVADTTVFQRIFPQERYHVWCSRLDILTLHPTLRWQLDFNKEWGLWFGKYGIFLTALGHI